MKNTTLRIFEDLFVRYPQLSVQKGEIKIAFELLLQCAQKGGTIFTCGNGGSAADAEHIVGELMKRFKKERLLDNEIFNKLVDFGDEGKALANSLEGSISAVALTSHIALSTAFANDKNPTAVFAQQLYGLGKSGDCLVAISTSGNSANCVQTMMVAKAKGISTVVLTGQNPCKMDSLATVTIHAPECETYKVQELHLPIYHTLCAMLENEIF